MCGDATKSNSHCLHACFCVFRRMYAARWQALQRDRLQPVAHTAVQHRGAQRLFAAMPACTRDALNLAVCMPRALVHLMAVTSLVSNLQHLVASVSRMLGPCTQ